jgi:hypothetical protein
LVIQKFSPVRSPIAQTPSQRHPALGQVGILAVVAVHVPAPVPVQDVLVLALVAADK